jgi:hypothetical protein
MLARRPWLLAPLSLAVGCGLLAEAERTALPLTDGGMDAPRSDRPAADRPDADRADVDDAGDGGDVFDAGDAGDVFDASDAFDAPADDGAAETDRPDVDDVTDAMDVPDAFDALDAFDATDAGDAADARDATDATSDGGDATVAPDAADARDVPDGDGALPRCPRPRLIAPLSNSVSTGPQVRFTFAPVPGVSTYRVLLCARRGCEEVTPTWSRDVSVVAEPMTASAVVLPSEVPSIVPGVYWWMVTSLGPGCAAASSEPWELRVGVTPPTTSGDATWWGAYADFNGDGYADLAVGDPAPMTSGSGVVYVHHGSSDAVPASPGTMLTRSAAGFGASVASAGDFDGDGYGDLAAAMDGAVQVFRGGASGLDSRVGNELVPAGLPPGATESRVVGVGDVNGDGFGDLVARASVAGTARVYFAAGGARATSFVEVPRPVDTTTATACPFYGASVAPAGDVNGDGFADFAIGCPAATPGGPSAMAPARVYVVLGGATFDPRAPRAVPLRPPAMSEVGSSFGHLVAGVGNATGTRRAAVAVGDETTGNHLRLFEFDAASPPSAAEVALPSGLPGLLSLLGPLRPLTALAGVGDVNRDGVGDYALAFGTGLAPAVVLVPSRQPPARFNPALLLDPVIAFAGAGDADADGFDDLAVGFRLTAGGGRVQVFRGESSFAETPIPAARSVLLSAPSGRTRYALSLANGR